MSYESVMGQVQEALASDPNPNQNWGGIVYGAPFVNVVPGANSTPEEAAAAIAGGGSMSPGRSVPWVWIVGGAAAAAGLGLLLFKTLRLNGVTTVVPAYGRDYKTAKAAKEAWKAGKDFIISDFFSPWDGKPINITDARRDGMGEVNIRFWRLTKVTVAKV
jgi:hypothetical protein